MHPISDSARPRALRDRLVPLPILPAGTAGTPAKPLRRSAVAVVLAGLVVSMVAGPAAAEPRSTDLVRTNGATRSGDALRIGEHRRSAAAAARFRALYDAAPDRFARAPRHRAPHHAGTLDSARTRGAWAHSARSFTRSATPAATPAPGATPAPVAQTAPAASVPNSATAWTFDQPALAATVDPPAPAVTKAASTTTATTSATTSSTTSAKSATTAATTSATSATTSATTSAKTSTASAVTTAATTATGTRKAALQPFSVTAPANVSFGSGAKFESASSTKTKALLGGSPQLNAAAWSVAVAKAKSTDPIATVKNIRNGVTWKFRVPSGAQVTTGTDKHLTVVQPDGYTAYECYKMTKVNSTTWTSTYIIKTDLRSNGLAAGARASGISQIMGLIRTEEVAAKKIPHTLAIAIPDSMLKSGFVWPARAQDSNSATAYKGPIPMGTMMGIPPSVDVTKLGLSPEGLALARALQDYGAHVLLRSSSVALYAEPLADSTGVYRMRSDWKNTLYPLMRVVTNNTSTNVAGGGTRRQPAAAPLS